VNPLNSTSGHLNAGAYAQTATTLTGADAGDYTLGGYTTPTNNYTVAQLALTGAAIAAGNSTYGSSVTPGAVSFSNVISGDLVGAAAGIVSPTYSTSNHLNAGGYAQTATTLTGADAGDYIFAGYTTPTNSYTVAQLALTGAAIAAGNSTYGSSVTPGVVSFSNVISGDLVGAAAGIVSPTYSTSNHLTAGSYAQTATTLTGADAGDYSFAGYTTPTNNYTVAQLALTVTGLTTTNRVYNGSTADALGGTPSTAPISGDVVSLNGTGSGSFADANVGTEKPVTVSGYTLKGSDAGNYLLVEPTGLFASIAQLASVAWVGGATPGNWSKASNWAGGAIPDYANVAAVTIPSGDTVTYDALVPGATVLTTLTDSGNLVMAAGNLSTSSNLSTAGYKQTGGILNVGGTLSINSTAGAVTLGNIVANSLSITSTAGAITQAASTAINVTGATTLTAINSNITLGNAANSFGGAVTPYGLNINLFDSSPGGLILGNTTASGTLTLTSLAGPIGLQYFYTQVNVTGATSLTADNGVTGTGDVKYNIGLEGLGSNSFGGPVSSNGLTIYLGDNNASGLVLGNTTATGNLYADTFYANPTTGLGAPITQGASTAVNVTGTTSLSAIGNYSVCSPVCGNRNAYGNITLTNTANSFGGAVSSQGLNINLLDSGAGGLVLGNTTATGTLTATSRGGAITETASMNLIVSGATSLTADNGVTGAGDVKYNITLSPNNFNNFGSSLSSNGLNVNLLDVDALVLGNTTATGTFTANSGYSITQAASTAIHVTGATSVTANNNNITLGNATNIFGGAVTSAGSNIDLVDGTGGLILGNTTATGTLTASSGGPITQAASTAVNVTGATSLTASGTSGSITLANATNIFGGAVASQGLNINLLDSSAGGLVLGNTTATGTFTADSLAGDITQAASTAVKVTGASSLTADNGVTGAGDVKYNVTLANATNKLVGAVTSNGLNIGLVNGTGGLVLGNTTATGTFTADSLAGAITQSASTAVNVTGATSLTADNGGTTNYAITLANTSNGFGGTVMATGSTISLDDAAALTAVLDSTGASALTSVGALNVSGTVGTSLTTITTGTNSATTFGATTVGTKLVVTSTGAVTETSPNILTVAGQGTTTVSNPNVTVNGVKGAEIP
jgi:hypothetical protein